MKPSNTTNKEKCTCGHSKDRHFFGVEEHCKEIDCKCERFESSSIHCSPKEEKKCEICGVSGCGTIVPKCKEGFTHGKRTLEETIETVEKIQSITVNTEDNKMIVTCASLDCPERKGGKCNAVIEDNKEWEEELLSLIHGYIYSKTWGGGNIFDESKDWKKIKSFIASVVDEDRRKTKKKLSEIHDEIKQVNIIPEWNRSGISTEEQLRHEFAEAVLQEFLCKSLEYLNTRE